MHWTLVVLALGTTPVTTGLSFPTLEDCYVAEEIMADEYAKSFNRWLKDNPGKSAPSFIRQRLVRGICVPSPK
jgi:hypothetical protein